MNSKAVAAPIRTLERSQIQQSPIQKASAKSTQRTSRLIISRYSALKDTLHNKFLASNHNKYNLIPHSLAISEAPAPSLRSQSAQSTAKRSHRRYKPMSSTGPILRLSTQDVVSYKYWLNQATACTKACSLAHFWTLTLKSPRTAKPWDTPLNRLICHGWPALMRVSSDSWRSWVVKMLSVSACGGVC